MSIQSEINRIQGNVNSAFAAVQTKGGTVPSVHTSDDLATAITSIPSGGTPEIKDFEVYGVGDSLVIDTTAGTWPKTGEDMDITSGNFEYLNKTFLNNPPLKIQVLYRTYYGPSPSNYSTHVQKQDFIRDYTDTEHITYNVQDPDGYNTIKQIRWNISTPYTSKVGMTFVNNSGNSYVSFARLYILGT